MSKIRCRWDNCKAGILNQNESKHAKSPGVSAPGAFRGSDELIRGCLLIQQVREDLRDLGAGSGAGGVQGAVGVAVDDLLAHGPLQGGDGVGGDLVLVGEAVQVLLQGHVLQALDLLVAEQDRGHLLAGHGVHGTEGRLVIAVDDLVGSGPGHCVAVPLARRHIRKLGSAGHSGGFFQPIQHGDDHGAVHRPVGGERRGRSAGHETLRISVLHGVIEPIAALHIRKGQGNRRRASPP